jgi:endonuclease/exonuclease/phosphatase (EEP) superfamily protein YafD
VLNPSRTKRLFTLFNNHLTSQFVAFGEDPVTAPVAKSTRRRRQCEAIARIVEAELRPDSPFLIVGDMNDTPASEALQPLVQGALGLVDALADPQETRLAKDDVPFAQTKAWTHRFKEWGNRRDTSFSIRSG